MPFSWRRSSAAFSAFASVWVCLVCVVAVHGLTTLPATPKLRVLHGHGLHKLQGHGHEYGLHRLHGHGHERAGEGERNDNDNKRKLQLRFLPKPLRKTIAKRMKPLSFVALTLLALSKTGHPNNSNNKNYDANNVLSIMSVQSAHAASAPMPLLPKQQMRDPVEEAMDRNFKEQETQNREQLDQESKKLRELGETQGPEAQKAYAKQLETNKIQEYKDKQAGLQVLQRQLLDQGICPFCDNEGYYQITKYDTGLDLAEVKGSRYFLEQYNQENNPKQSERYLLRAHRFILKSTVEDLKKRGVDPLKYFEENQVKTTKILQMLPFKAESTAREYAQNLATFGQMNQPLEGEELLPSLEVVEARAAAAAKGGASKSNNNADKVAKQKAKAAMAVEKLERKKEAAVLNQQKKEEKAAGKAAKKEEKAAAKAAIKAAAALALASSAASVSAAAVESTTMAVAGSAESTIAATDNSHGSERGVVADESITSSGAEDKGDIDTTTTKTKVKPSSIPIVPVSIFLAAAGGGGYAFQVYKKKADQEEEERQRQFKLIMGDADDKDTWSAPPLEEVEVDTNDLDIDADFMNGSASAAQEPPAPSETNKKKKKGGMGAMFSKKNGNNRETNLDVLLSEKAASPGFSLLLAKLLAFGAPGRFPKVVGLSSEGMDISAVEDKFDLETAKETLQEFRTDNDLDDKASAEIFANVVNCMLIDIVDLASSTLKEKKDKVTLEAVNVVVDFMNHAASLYDAVAGGVAINPVTYGGRLGKGKLEQMFTAYATAAGADQGRLQLLQDVFGISDKKVEGIMMQDMQKKMMSMMKGETPEGMEGMEEMMAAMGGEGNMEGMMEGMMGGGDMPEPSPEETKKMLIALKDMKDAGMIPPEELAEVRNQFADSFGSSIEELMAKADGDAEQLDPEEKEMLDLMKSILDD